MTEPSLTVADVAVRLRITPYTVRQILRAGHLRGSRPGKRWLVTERDLAAYIAGAENRPPERRRRRRAS